MTDFFSSQSTESINENVRVGVERAERELRLQVDYVSFLVEARQAFVDLPESQRRRVIFDASARFYPELFRAHPETLPRCRDLRLPVAHRTATGWDLRPCRRRVGERTVESSGATKSAPA